MCISRRCLVIVEGHKQPLLGPEQALRPPTGLAASYARRAVVSNDGLRGQHAENVECAAAHGWSIPDDPAFRFSDDGESGASAHRPGLDALLARVRSGEASFDRVYMRDVTRPVRSSDPRWRYWFEYEMERFGVRILYATDEVGAESRDEKLVASKPPRLSALAPLASTSSGGSR